ncbi:hypothetical protein BGV48_18130 [Burkholderia ubonensis]|nr:hypothetical protein BGV48_18130 [Burkholderia ubonensis]
MEDDSCNRVHESDGTREPSRSRQAKLGDEKTLCRFECIELQFGSFASPDIAAGVLFLPGEYHFKVGMLSALFRRSESVFEFGPEFVTSQSLRDGRK